MNVDLDEITLAKLARELVMNIRNYKYVFADYKIDENDYCEIEKNEFFRKVKEQYTIEWNSAASTEDRLKLGSMAYLEQLFPALTRRALTANEPLPAATGVASLLMKTAGIGTDSKGDAKSASERFVITINLGADVEHYNKSVAVDANDVDLGKISGGSHGQIIDAQPQISTIEFLRAAGQRQRP